MGDEALVKLVVMVPVDHEEKVRLALGAAGAGRSENYEYCSFVTRGTGYFRPLAGATPFIGSTGELTAVDEVQLSTVCARSLVPRVLAALRDAHPYEEIAYEIIPLLNHEYRMPPESLNSASTEKRVRTARGGNHG